MGYKKRLTIHPSKAKTEKIGDNNRIGGNVNMQIGESPIIEKAGSFLTLAGSLTI
jgi:hypothetical protein